MEDKLISFETAKLAKGKGFDINTKGSYDLTNGVRLNMNYIVGHYNCKDVCCITTQSLLQKWLREEHDFHIYIVPNGDNSGWKIANVRDVKVDRLVYHIRDNFESIKFNTYEESLEVGLQEALKLIK